MAWGLLIIGAAMGIAMLMVGARGTMLIAVGMYLPFDTSAAMFTGGVVRLVLDRFAARRSAEDQVRIEEKATLLASGLIAGEAILGILLAVTFLSGIRSFSELLTGAAQPAFYPALGGWLSLIGFAAVAWVLIRIPLRRAAAVGVQRLSSRCVGAADAVMGHSIGVRIARFTNPCCQG